MTFVHCQSPRWFYGILGERALHVFYNLFLALIVGILNVFPHFKVKLIGIAVFKRHFHIVVIQLTHLANGAVDPTAVFVVANENDLCPFFKHELFGRRQVVVWKRAFNQTTEVVLLGFECLHMLVVDGINGVAASSQSHDKAAAVSILRIASRIKQGKVGLCSSVNPHTVEQRNKRAVGLAVNFSQFYGHKAKVTKSKRIEKEELLIVDFENVAHFTCHNRFELKNIAHKKQLLAAKGFTHIARIYTKHLVNKVDNVGSDH